MNVLYVFVRELNSMSHGKALAHSGHAAAHFVANHHFRSGEYNEVNDWVGEASGFGTQINLSASDEDIFKAIKLADEKGFINSLIWDPTYPYDVNDEIVNLLPAKLHTDLAVQITPDTWRCFRKEWTAAYIFGDKDKLRPIVGEFPLA